MKHVWLMISYVKRDTTAKDQNTETQWA
jgi:hypothetical protein